jgi:hypothetical protein
MKDAILKILGLRVEQTFRDGEVSSGVFSIHYTVSEEMLKHPRIIIWHLQGLQAQICQKIEEKISQLKDLAQCDR